MEKSTEKTTVHLKSKVDFTRDRNGRLHDAAGRFVSEFIQDTENAFQRLNRPGGPLSRIGEGISDAIGAGAGVSGKSPLVTVLGFAFGALAAAIAAVVQIANALVAVLTTIPALIVAIGLQAGVLMLAFNGVGKAISGAFAAKNWTDFYKALEGLTPAAKNFVVTLVPIRDLFRELKTSVQESFFRGLGNVMINVANALGPILKTGLPQLAAALGQLFGYLGMFFASPTFVDFVKDVIPATIRWLQSFGPGFIGFLSALINMAHAAIPFLERVGQIVGNAFKTFSDWLNTQVQSGALLDWLDRMGTTLDKTAELFFNITEFVASFIDALDKAGGNNIIDQISEFFYQLAVFFQSPAGQAAMAGFVHLIEAMTYAFSGLVFGILGLLIAFESVLQFLQFVGYAFQKLVSWITDTAGPALMDFFTVTLPGWVGEAAGAIAHFFSNISDSIRAGFGAAVDWVQAKWNEFSGWISSKVSSVVNFFRGIPDNLAQIGRDIMNGLRDGLQWGWDHTVGPILHWITSQIPSWKGPEEKDRKLLEPAGQAVMEGFGKGLSQGADQMRNMLGDFTNSMGDIGARGSEAGGMPINVMVNFHGALPTEQQAYETGVAAGKGVGDGFTDQVNQRNVRLAMRVA